jgi:hypothetical protein
MSVQTPGMKDALELQIAWNASKWSAFEASESQQSKTHDWALFPELDLPPDLPPDILIEGFFEVRKLKGGG